MCWPHSLKHENKNPPTKTWQQPMNSKVMFPLQLKLFFYSNLNVSDVNPVHRHFFISEGYYNCGKDKGWVVVIDGIGPCAMDKATRTTVYYVDTHSYSLMPGGKIYKIKTHLCYQICMTTGWSHEKII